LLPVDAEFKGYEEVVVQDIKLTTDNVLFRKQKYSPSQREKTYLAELPDGYEGEFDWESYFHKQVTMSTLSN